jgi:hypothetical protein
MKVAFSWLAAICVVAPAGAAELPSRRPDPAPRKAETCEINGQPGYKLPGGDVCLRMSGYVGGQISAGNLAK